jgi:lysozyme
MASQGTERQGRVGSGGRRRWLVLVGVAGLVAVLVAGWALLWVPNWRPPLQPGERYGIDVSAHQDTIDWPRVAGDQIEFVYVKASEGGDHVDRRFKEHWAGAGVVGLERGAYHFFTLCTPGEAQARNFLAAAPPDPAALPPAVDLEIAGNCSGRPDPAAVDAELETFLDLVERAWGRHALLYVGDDWERTYPIRGRVDRLLWHRRFLLRPDVAGWWIWQLHGFARIEGASGRVDLNVMRQAPDR